MKAFFNRPYEPTKLCKDCFWHVTGSKAGAATRSRDNLCTHPKNTRVSLVTGQPLYSEDLGTLRYGTMHDPGDCGEKGKWWEAKIDG